jgi:hypothetical protein
MVPTHIILDKSILNLPHQRKVTHHCRHRSKTKARSNTVIRVSIRSMGNKSTDYQNNLHLVRSV